MLRSRRLPRFTPAGATFSKSYAAYVSISALSISLSLFALSLARARALSLFLFLSLSLALSRSCTRSRARTRARALSPETERERAREREGRRSTACAALATQAILACNPDQTTLKKWLQRLPSCNPNRAASMFRSCLCFLLALRPDSLRSYSCQLHHTDGDQGRRGIFYWR